MKKIFLAAIFISVSFFLMSCGSTNIPAQPENSNDALTQRHEEVADEIAGQINTAAQSPEELPSAESAPEENLSSEKSGSVPQDIVSQIRQEPDDKTAEKSDSNNEQNKESDSTEKSDTNSDSTEKTDAKSNSAEQTGVITGISYVSTSPSKAKATIIDRNKNQDKSNKNSDSDSPKNIIENDGHLQGTDSNENAVQNEIQMNQNESESKENAKSSSENESLSESNSGTENTSSSESLSSSENNLESEKDSNLQNDTEKVSDEDSNLEKEGGEAPTTDEKTRVSEYKIIEEPESQVKDLPEPEPKTEVEKSPVPSQEIAETEGAEVQENTKETEKAEQTSSEKPAREVHVPESAENTASDANASTDEDIIEEIKVEAEKPVIPSRSVKVNLSQYLDVTYPGTGWIYIGETEKNPLFNYFGRKLGTGNTTFALRAKKAGTTLLHFYKNDALTGEYIDDYLEVEVSDSRSTGRIKAPSYADIIPAKPQRRIDRATENAAFERIISEQQERDNKNEGSQQTTEKTKEEKSAENKKSVENPKELAVSAPKTPSGNVMTESSPQAGLSTVPAVSAAGSGSDVKTVIKNTDSASSSTSSVGNTVSESEKNSQDSEATEQAQETPAFNYTPVSSQSNKVEEGPVVSEPVVIVEDSSAVPDEFLLEKAKKDFEEKNYELALSEAQQYYNTASTRLDEALYLLGQIWESNSSIKNIRSAVDSYDSLAKLYPASKLWKKARNRSIYLKRFYIDIR